VQRGTFKLVEACAGTGQLVQQGTILRAVRYTLNRYQGMLEGSGMPIPGLHRVEGTTDFQVGDEQAHLLGTELTLRLEDGRAVPVTLADRTGRLLSVGHGPGPGCTCC
jgi:hypothetical protein